ncbi:pyruvate carboxyltransferase [Bacillus sp. BRMEA1]|uniref:LeuA family protein n=1 Tax=Neobacillus endophyticus TaxID=2738405 RepID=UPI001564885B|nr:pyruvate carboxyltransferase [Neobacillus endophyticus]NRD77090.1 pyruvate carboxyltransferase [Neobacillus endophyticus]
MKPLKQISIFDTTLRDGEQAPGNSMTYDQKLEIFSALDSIGVNVIETGFPSATEYDFNVTKELGKLSRNAKICTFSRANVTDLDVSIKALNGASNFQVQILVVGSEIHLEHKRQITAESAIQEAVSSVRYLRSHGIQDISVIIEDATRGSYDYLKRLIHHSVEAGATTVVLADTVGCSIPEEFGNLVKNVRGWIGSNIKLSVHCHDDLGLALANSLAGIAYGADEVQTTLCGIGERAGNTALEELVAVMLYKKDLYNCYTDIDNLKIYEACQLLINKINLPMTRYKSIIGDYVFSTEAGIHQQGMIRNPLTYEFVEPHKFGRERRMIIGPHSGRSILRDGLEKQDIKVDPYLIDQLYNVIMASGDFDQINDPECLMNKYLELKSTMLTTVI